MGTIYWMMVGVLALFVFQLWLLGLARRTYARATGQPVPVRARPNQHPALRQR